MAEIKTAWLAYFDVDNNVVLVESAEAKVTAKRVQMTVPDRFGHAAIRTYDIDKVRFSREEAIDHLRAKTQSDLHFAQEKVTEATKQLKNLDAFEKPRKYTLDGKVP